MAPRAAAPPPERTTGRFVIRLPPARTDREPAAVVGRRGGGGLFPAGGAAPTVIRRFPPERGSSSMQVLDFDGDRALDLLVTAGDNADFTPVFKRGHGIRLYLGDGRGGFRLALFHCLDGAYGAVAEDFDADGDRDIAAVAWFADYSGGPDGAALPSGDLGGGPDPNKIDNWRGVQGRAGSFLVASGPARVRAGGARGRGVRGGTR